MADTPTQTSGEFTESDGKKETYSKRGKKKAQKKKTTKPRVFTEAQRDVRRATSLNWYYYNMENTPGFKEAQREKSARYRNAKRERERLLEEEDEEEEDQTKQQLEHDSYNLDYNPDDSNLHDRHSIPSKRRKDQVIPGPSTSNASNTPQRRRGRQNGQPKSTHLHNMDDVANPMGKGKTSRRGKKNARETTREVNNVMGVVPPIPTQTPSRRARNKVHKKPLSFPVQRRDLDLPPVIWIKSESEEESKPVIVIDSDSELEKPSNVECDLDHPINDDGYGKSTGSDNDYSSTTCVTPTSGMLITRACSEYYYDGDKECPSKAEWVIEKVENPRLVRSSSDNSITKRFQVTSTIDKSKSLERKTSTKKGLSIKKHQFFSVRHDKKPATSMESVLKNTRKSSVPNVGNKRTVNPIPCNVVDPDLKQKPTHIHSEKEDTKPLRTNGYATEQDVLNDNTHKTHTSKWKTSIGESTNVQYAVGKEVGSIGDVSMSEVPPSSVSANANPKNNETEVLHLTTPAGGKKPWIVWNLMPRTTFRHFRNRQVNLTRRPLPQTWRSFICPNPCKLARLLWNILRNATGR